MIRIWHHTLDDNAINSLFRSYNYRLHVRCHDVFDNAKTTTALWTVLSHYANMLQANTTIRKNQKTHKHSYFWAAAIQRQPNASNVINILHFQAFKCRVEKSVSIATTVLILNLLGNLNLNFSYLLLRPASYSYIHSISTRKMSSNKSGLSKPYHAALLPCGVVEGECCSWISNFLGLEGISLPTFLPCPVSARASRSHLTLSIAIKTTNKQHQHAASGHSRNSVACYGTKY